MEFSNYIVTNINLVGMLKAEEGFGKNNNPADVTVYDDNAKPSKDQPGHNPTIGYGLNLRNSEVLFLVLNQILLPNGQNVFQNAPNVDPNDIVDAFAANIATYPSALYPNETALESALSVLLDSYASVASNYTSFQINTDQGAAILNRATVPVFAFSYSSVCANIWCRPSSNGSQ